MPIVHALLAQLDRIGVEGFDARFERHRAMREMVERWVDDRDDVTILAPAGKRSDTVTALVFREHSASQISARLDDAGWQVGAGLGDDSDRELRIGHMGQGTLEQLRALLETIEGVI